MSLKSVRFYHIEWTFKYYVAEVNVYNHFLLQTGFISQ